MILLQCLVNFNKTFFKLQLRGVARKVKKNKTTEMIKKELFGSILEFSNEEEDYLRMNEEVRNAKEPKDGISLIKKYEDLLKGTNKRIINIVVKQSEILKCFKEEDEFFDSVSVSRSNIYFKISLCKFFAKIYSPSRLAISRAILSSSKKCGRQM